MQTKKAGGFAILAAALTITAGPALAQCPVPWDGDEPFTHFGVDESGKCTTEAGLVNGVYLNGFYPDCQDSNGDLQQRGHAHFEYTHLQPADDNRNEEKDYFADPERFAEREPGRFANAFDRKKNPPDSEFQWTGGYWQVDEWIGPANVPNASWTERFFECSGPVPCANVPDLIYPETTASGPRTMAPSYGGYWSDHRRGFVICGDGGITPEGQRSVYCGGAMTACPGLESFAE